MFKLALTFCVVGLLSCQACGAASFSIVDNHKPRAAIVVGSNATPTELHAAEELAKYVKQMTGAKLEICMSNAMPNDPGLGRILIGRPENNPLIEKLVRSRVVNLSSEDPGMDGYIIQTAELSDRFDSIPVLVLGGSRDRGTLYAVYDLLSRYAHVGFFWDAERVPSMSDFSIPHVSVKERPFFRDRLMLQLQGGYGVWCAGTADDWRKRIDWLAKNRMNQFLLAGNPQPGLFMKKVRARLGISPEPVASAAEKAEVELFHEILRYARLVDVDALSCLAITPEADESMRKKFPDGQYFQTSWLDLSAPVYHISPLGPLFKKFYGTATQVWREMFPESGHVYYGGGPYSETKFHNVDREETEKILVEFNTRYMEAVKEADPQATVQVSGWCWAFDPNGFWTKEVTKKLFDTLPTEDYILWDLTCEIWPMYTSDKLNHWWGRPWIFGVLHAYGGDDEIHGDLAGTLERTMAIVRDPKASNCVGFAQTAELFGYSMLYQDFLWKLAWDPRDVTLGEYLSDFALRRYGTEAGPKLVPNLRELAKTVYGPRGGSRELHQHRPYVNNWAPRWDLAWGILSPPESVKTARVLDSFVRALLEHENQLGGEDVYRNDVVDFTRQCLTEIANVRRICIDNAFAEGDRARFEAEVKYYDELLDEMEKVLSVRPEYRVEYIKKEQASSPFGPKDGGRGLRDGGLTFAVSVPGIIDYQARGMYELLKFYDRPRIDAYVEYLRKRMDQGLTTAPAEELDVLYRQIEVNWVENGYDPKDAKAFTGTAPQACAAALAVELGLRDVSFVSKITLPEGLNDVESIGAGKCVGASSTTPGTTVLGATDGDVSWGTSWASAGVPVGGAIGEQFLVFDFEQPRVVVALQYFIENSDIGAAAQRYCKEYVVEVSDDGESWRQVASGTFPSGVTTPKQPLPLVKLSEPTKARYLKFRMLNSYVGNIIVIGELQVWGR